MEFRDNKHFKSWRLPLLALKGCWWSCLQKIVVANKFPLTLIKKILIKAYGFFEASPQQMWNWPGVWCKSLTSMTCLWDAKGTGVQWEATLPAFPWSRWLWLSTFKQHSLARGQSCWCLLILWCSSYLRFLAPQTQGSRHVFRYSGQWHLSCINLWSVLREFFWAGIKCKFLFKKLLI